MGIAAVESGSNPSFLIPNSQGETAEELAGLARAMLDVCVPVNAGENGASVT